MKNKILSFLIVLSLLMFAGLTFAGEIGDKFSVGDVRIDSDSYLYGTNATFTGDITTSKMSFHETWIDVAAADTDTIKNVDISSTTLLAGTTTWLPADLDARQITPRNFTCVISSMTTGADYAEAAAGSLVITGTDAKGQSATETISVSSNSATGNVAFTSVTSFALTMTSLGDAGCASPKTCIGIGDKLGLANDISATSSIYKVLATGAVEQSTTYTANATYDTIDFDDVPDASSDYEVWYLKY